MVPFILEKSFENGIGPSMTIPDELTKNIPFFKLAGKMIFLFHRWDI